MTEHRPRVARKDVERIYPLSPLQQGMLFHELSEPQAGVYFRQTTFSIAGEFDIRVCGAAWNALMARHELLRSVFDYENTSHFLQIVLKEREVEFVDEDLRGLDQKAQCARLDAYRHADWTRGFDLRRDVLMRVGVFRLADRAFELIWSHPHILLDGWSGSVLLKEFAEVYAGLRAGRPWLLPAPTPYQAYLDQVAKHSETEALGYWTRQLDGYQDLASVPRLRAVRPAGDVQPRQHVLSLNAARTAGLERVAARNGVTASTVMRALWGVMLARYNDTNDVVFGSVVSGRTVDVPNVERMVGLFINTIPVRVRIEPDESFAALLARLQNFAVESMAYEHVSLARIQATSALPKGLLDHLLVFENYPAPETWQAGVSLPLGFEVTAVHADERANYDFGLLIHPGASMQVAFQYNANVYGDGQMRRLEGQLLELVDRVNADDAVPVGRLEIVSAAERQRLLQFADGPVVDRPAEATLVSLWEAQAAKTPERTALVFGSESLSYRELDAWAEAVADDVAQYLGVAREAPVGVFAARGPRRIAALLGILKAGGAYLPLNPALPAERIRHILADTACPLVLADAGGSATIEQLHSGLARPIRDSSLPTGSRTRSAVGPRDLAYIIYTSGSTGRPKGVLVEHGGFVNMIREQIRGFAVGADDRVLQFASCSFDASLSEIFMALLAGATLVLADEEIPRDGHRFTVCMREQHVTVVTLPPSYLRALERLDFPDLRVLITAGEPPDDKDARRYAGSLRYFNAYGPTEASVCASFHEVRPGAEYPNGIPVGRPLANTSIRILDREGRLMPLGAPGEICIGGRGLARGYRGNPELTAEKFVASPFAGDVRLYRTGDLGVLLEDGEVVFLGRRDHQVKLRGHRVELGEIEATLREFPRVQDAAVVLHAQPDRVQHLSAYVVSPDTLDLAALRSHLAGILPGYMLPAAVTQLASFPRTNAGKLDRRALPAAEPVTADANIGPRNAGERAIAAAFEDVLRCSGVGSYHSFSALGGDSLTAIKVANRLRAHGFVIDLRQFLRLDTVAAIAAAMHEERADARTAVGSLPLTPIQRWFFEEQREGARDLSHAVLIGAVQRLEELPLRAAIEAIWRHHDALRLRFRFAPDGIAQHIADPSDAIDFRTVDLRSEPHPWSSLAADAKRLHGSFDLATGPLFKAVCCRLPENDYLLLIAHHLVVDAVSWRLLLEDTIDAYRQACRGDAVRLPAKTSSYQDWARHLTAYCRSEALLADKSYWRVVEAAATPPLRTDAPPIRHRYDETRTADFRIAMLDERMPESTIQAVLLAALARALVAWDGRYVTRVMLTCHGRLPPGRGVDVSRTVGWFTAEFPFLLRSPQSDDAAQNMRDVAHQLGEALPRAVGYGILRWLAPEDLVDDLTFGPRPEVTVNYIGRAASDVGEGFSLSDRLPGASFGLLERTSLLDVEAMTDGPDLAVSLRYCPAVHRHATAQELCDLLRDELTAALAAVRAAPPIFLLERAS